MSTADTLRALDESIAHWERLAFGPRRPGESIEAGECALCALFFAEVCYGCPVRERTGLRYCSGSPYVFARQAREDYGLDSGEFHTAARAELEFLRALRLELTPDAELDELLARGLYVEFPKGDDA